MKRWLMLAVLILPGCEEQIPGSEWLVTWHLGADDIEHKLTTYGWSCRDQADGVLAIHLLRSSRRATCTNECASVANGRDDCQVQCEGDIRFVQSHCSPRSKSRSELTGVSRWSRLTPK